MNPHVERLFEEARQFAEKHGGEVGRIIRRKIRELRLARAEFEAAAEAAEAAKDVAHNKVRALVRVVEEVARHDGPCRRCDLLSRHRGEAGMNVVEYEQAIDLLENYAWQYTLGSELRSCAACRVSELDEHRTDCEIRRAVATLMSIAHRMPEPEEPQP